MTGLGYLFANTKFANFLKLVLRYFISSRINSLVDVIIFQNKDNQTKFVEYTKFKNRVEIIEGSGLQTKLITKKESFNKKLKIIFVGRLLKEKGIFEYIDIINQLSNHEDLEFYIAGSRDPGNRSSLTEKDFKAIEISKKLRIKNFALSFTNLDNLFISGSFELAYIPFIVCLSSCSSTTLSFPNKTF